MWVDERRRMALRRHRPGGRQQGHKEDRSRVRVGSQGETKEEGGREGGKEKESRLLRGV